MRDGEYLAKPRSEVGNRLRALRDHEPSALRFTIEPTMKKILLTLITGVCCFNGCSKSSAPAASSGAMAPSSAKSADAVLQKLLEYSGGGSTDCGRVDVHAAEKQLKAASDCAMQAAQGKHAFYVAYDMPGMSVGVAGASNGKLFTVQAQGSGSSAALSSGACPSQLRVAASGRVSCFAPGDMTSMGGSHAGGAMPPGMANPQGGGGTIPHSAAPSPQGKTP